MLRTILLAVFPFLALTAVRAQGAPDINAFATEFQKAFEYKDDKALDKLIKSKDDMPAAGLTYFQELRVELWAGKASLQPKVDMIKAAWKRVFEGTPVLEKLERWIESQDPASFATFRKVQGNITRSWNHYAELAAHPESPRAEFEHAYELLVESADQMDKTGHKVEAAEAWKLVAVCKYRMPDKSLQDRKDYIFALERFVELRQAWEWTQDLYFTLNQNSLKGARQELEAKSKDADKRKSEGYTDGAKGIDALVVPGSVEKMENIQFALLDSWDEELDYCQRGGPVPAFWWSASFGKDTKDAKVPAFSRVDLSLIRAAMTKFGVSTMPSDAARTQEVDASGKAKASKFFLDADKKQPYGMFFWLGSDRERLGEAEVNLAPADVNTNVYCRSAASWTAPVGGETLTFYDDNGSGWPMDGDPFALKYAMHTLGMPVKTDGGDADPRAITPLLDSMRIGKGPRQPFSEFVHIGPTWHHVHRVANKDGDQLGTRPLNVEYLKLGKVKLVWNGPKPTAPDQLVVCGSGDYKTACFELAGGKEVEVPSGEYRVIWGRILEGKGARVQMGTIYGADSKPFTVEAGKTFELKMGAPFSIDFERKGSVSEVAIDATRIGLREASGCVVADLHGMAVIPEVLASKMADGKGAKPIGKFVRCTDAEVLNKVAELWRDIGLMIACLPMPEGCRGDKKESMTLTLKLPAAGMKVGLAMKKHPLFGKLDSAWK